MKGFILNERAAMRVGNLLERSFVDAGMCTIVGHGIPETREAVNRRYKPGRVGYRRHPDGRVAIIVNAAARTRLIAWRDAAIARRAADAADEDDAELADMPEDDLDETTWGP
jgi:hypothetical protein